MMLRTILSPLDQIQTFMAARSTCALSCSEFWLFSMQSPNPYQSPALKHLPGTGMRSKKLPSSLGVHCVAFQVSYWVLTFAVAICYAGTTETAIQFQTPKMLLLIGAFGVGAWMPHAILAAVYKRIRTSGLVCIAMLGAASFVLWYPVFNMINSHFNSLSSFILNGTPGHIRLAIWSALSVLPALGLAVTWARIQSNPQDNQRLDRSADGPGF